MPSISCSSIRSHLFLAGFLALSASGSLVADPGVGANEIVIGQSIALQGGKNAYGVAAAEGAKLYFDMVNASGGVHGRKIVTRVLDDDNKASNAESNARQLIADGAFILYGSIEGGPSTAVATVASEQKVPFFGPMAGSPTLRRPLQHYVFPVRAEHRDEFRALMTWGKSTGLTTLGFLHADSDVGKSHLENVKLLAAELGMKLVTAIPFKGDVSDVQIDEMVKNIADSRITKMDFAFEYNHENPFPICSHTGSKEVDNSFNADDCIHGCQFGFDADRARAWAAGCRTCFFPSGAQSGRTETSHIARVSGHGA